MWNGNGSTLALGGTQRQMLPNGEARDVGMVQFYTPHGHHMRTLKVPGGGITALSWEVSYFFPKHFCCFFFFFALTKILFFDIVDLFCRSFTTYCVYILTFFFLLSSFFLLLVWWFKNCTCC